MDTTTSTETLRRAAALMRERAMRARAGSWSVGGTTDGTAAVIAQWESGRDVAICTGSLPDGNLANAEHIVSWEPAVALAVADLLGRVADDYPIAQYGYWSECALTIARTYLGDPVIAAS